MDSEKINQEIFKKARQKKKQMKKIFYEWFKNCKKKLPDSMYALVFLTLKISVNEWLTIL